MTSHTLSHPTSRLTPRRRHGRMLLAMGFMMAAMAAMLVMN